MNDQGLVMAEAGIVVVNKLLIFAVVTKFNLVRYNLDQLSVFPNKLSQKSTDNLLHTQGNNNDRDFLF